MVSDTLHSISFVVPAQAGIQVLRSYLAARYDLDSGSPPEFIPSLLRDRDDNY
jgi:hypothetical protein